MTPSQTAVKKTTHPSLTISIIIPSYNYSHLITRALESIFNQHVTFITSSNISSYNSVSEAINIETIIVDDCSTDNSIEVINNFISNFKYNNKYDHTIFNEPIIIQNSQNSGPAHSRNTGIIKSKGDYIIFLDADDVLTQHSLFNIYKIIIEQHPEIIIANHSTILSKQPHRSESKLQPNSKNLMGKYSTTQSNFVTNTLSNNIEHNIEQRFKDYLFNKKLPITAGSIIFHQNFFNKILFCEDLSLNEDLPVFAHAVLSNNLVYLNFETVCITKHNDSLRNQHHLLDERKNTIYLADIVFENQYFPKELKYLKKYFISSRYLSLFRSHYLAGDFTHAKEYYIKAIRYKFKNIFKLNYLIKYLKALLQ